MKFYRITNIQATILAGILSGLLVGVYYLGYISGHRVGYKIAREMVLKDTPPIPILSNNGNVSIEKSEEIGKIAYRELSKGENIVEDSAQHDSEAINVAPIQEKAVTKEDILQLARNDKPVEYKKNIHEEEKIAGTKKEVDEEVKELLGQGAVNDAPKMDVLARVAEDDVHAEAMDGKRESAKSSDQKETGPDEQQPAKTVNKDYEFEKTQQKPDNKPDIITKNSEGDSLKADSKGKKLQEEKLGIAKASSKSIVKESSVSDKSVKQKKLQEVNLTTKLAKGWYAQVAAPSDLAKAKNLALNLRRSGFNAIIEVAHVRGQKYFRVLVGPEDRMSLAEALVAQLSREPYVKTKPFVKRIK